MVHSVNSPPTQELTKLVKKNIPVVRCSRTGFGVVNFDEGTDGKHGFIPGGSLNPQKARILLATGLANNIESVELIRAFQEY